MINVDGISYVTTRFKILEREQELGDCDQILNLVEVLEKLSSNSESIQLQLFSKDFLSSLLDVLDYYSTSAHVLIDESDSDEKETFISILDHLARVITNITLPDENVSRLINDTAYLERLISWLDRQCTSEDPEVMTATVDTQKMVAGLCIGNLGSNDASATKLIHDVKIHEKLLSVLKTTNNLRVQHAVVSSLRNLALSPNNKIVLAETSLVELSLPLLSTFAQPIHLAIISIIRMLAPSSAQVSCDLVMKKFSSPNGMEQSAIEALMSHFEKSDDQPTICEIGKTITAFVKLLWGTFSADLDPAVDTAKILLMEITRLEPIYRLNTSQYLVLQNEGVLALAIILKSAQAGGQLREIIQKYPPKIEIINSLISILSNSKVQVTQVKSNDEEESNPAGAKAYPVEMRLNVAQLFLSSRVVFPDEMSKLGPTLAQTYQHLQEEPMTGNEKLQQLKELTNMLCGNESIEK
ncbi:hypothetical protein BKA69DRAFT_455979 [Paraphysoderma sedebokerense]|nr:hypothetical protein BKA69DRAFT_455979 [Paraphysoderma sedebokerense]